MALLKHRDAAKEHSICLLMSITRAADFEDYFSARYYVCFRSSSFIIIIFFIYSPSPRRYYQIRPSYHERRPQYGGGARRDMMSAQSAASLFRACPPAMSDFRRAMRKRYGPAVMPVLTTALRAPRRCPRRAAADAQRAAIEPKSLLSLMRDEYPMIRTDRHAMPPEI